MDVDHPYSVSVWLNLGFQFSPADIDQSVPLQLQYVSGADQSVLLMELSFEFFERTPARARKEFSANEWLA